MNNINTDLLTLVRQALVDIRNDRLTLRIRRRQDLLRFCDDMLPGGVLDSKHDTVRWNLADGVSLRASFDSDDGMQVVAFGLHVRGKVLNQPVLTAARSNILRSDLLKALASALMDWGADKAVSDAFAAAIADADSCTANAADADYDDYDDDDYYDYDYDDYDDDDYDNDDDWH